MAFRFNPTTSHFGAQVIMSPPRRTLLPLSIAFFVTAACWVEGAFANVCGSSMSRYLVPDYICFDAQGARAPYASCDNGRGGGALVRQKVDFSSACRRHDACYGAKGSRKSNCDTTFYRDLTSACRAQLGQGVPEATRRRCFETTLQYNDVIRGQATRRVGLWMTQQVPFTGRSACQAFVSAQKKAGASNPNCD